MGSGHDDLCHDGQLSKYSRGLVERHQYQYLFLYRPSHQPMDKQLGRNQQRPSIHEFRIYKRFLRSGKRWLDHRLQHRLGI